jgi:hypothetical protein
MSMRFRNSIPYFGLKALLGAGFGRGPENFDCQTVRETACFLIVNDARWQTVILTACTDGQSILI